MLDFYVDEYNEKHALGSFLPSYVPQNYRYYLSKNENENAEESLLNWNKNKNFTLELLVEKTEKAFGSNIPFAYACAPSNSGFFVNDIEKAFSEYFPEYLSLSKCFNKNGSFTSSTKKKRLSDKTLQSNFSFNLDTISENGFQDIDNFVLLDDVYAFGNTFKGMILALSKVFDIKKLNIKTGVILKTVI